MEIDRDKKSNVSFTHPSTVSLLNGPSRDIMTKLSGTTGISPRGEKDRVGGKRSGNYNKDISYTLTNNYLILSTEK